MKATHTLYLLFYFPPFALPVSQLCDDSGSDDMIWDFCSYRTAYRSTRCSR